MKVKNLLNVVQSITVKDVAGEYREYQLYIEPQATIEIERNLMIVPSSLSANVIIVDENVKESVKTPTVVEVKSVETPKVEEVNPAVEEPAVTDKFICDTCGAEFASAKGLSSHKNKAHPAN